MKVEPMAQEWDSLVGLEGLEALKATLAEVHLCLP